MTITKRVLGQLIVGIGVTVAISSAPVATAEPADLFPTCSGYETPANTACKAAPPDRLSPTFHGANPLTPINP
jgi:hypothetical protein